MYKKFFGLQENPFNVTPDPRFLYSTPHTEEALACLTYGVQARKGFVMLTGDVGTGKTTLLNKLLEWLRQEQIASAYVFNPRLNPFQFLDYAMSDFGINCESRLKSGILSTLNNWLLERYQAGTTAVLIVDEAQDASPELLEEIRLLTNLETPSGKLLQIVLSGQQELEMKLRLPEFRQLRQRIMLRAKTHPLTLEETHEYVATRLRIGGSDGRPIFSPDAIDALRHYSEGIPRIINILCEDSLISAFAGKQPIVSKEIVEEMARELELDLYPATAPPPPEQRLDDLVQPGVYTNRGKPNVAAGQPPSPEQYLNNEIQPEAFTPPPERSAFLPPSPPPPQGVSPQPMVRKQTPVALQPIEPRAMERTAVWAPKNETATAEPFSPASGGIGWAEEPAAPAPRTDVGAITLSRPEVSQSDDEILNTLRTKGGGAKTPPPAPVAKPPISATSPRPAPASLPFVMAKEPHPQSRVLWLAIAGTLIAGLVGAYLILKHTSQTEPPAAVTAPAPPPVAPPPSPETATAPSPAADIGAPAQSPDSAPAEVQPTLPPAAQPAARVQVHPTPAPQPAPKQVPPPAESALKIRPAGSARTSSPGPAQPAEPSEAPPQAFGKAVITSSVEGATISVDGKTMSDWVTPHVFPNLGVGAHTVVVSKPGFEDVSTRMTIREGQTTYFRATLASSSGEITILTEPPGLPVSFDGGPFQISPVQMTLAAGPHKYRIQLPNSKVYEGSVEMRAGSIITRRVDFSGGEWLNPAK